MKANDNSKINVWVKSKEIKCKKPFSGCRCYEAHRYEQVCECINLTERPEWPSLGILRWNASSSQVENYWFSFANRRTVILPGEIHKNGNGNYMKKWNKVTRWPPGNLPVELITEFEIIVPSDDGKTFLKYAGNGNSNICTKQEVDEEGSLYTLWWKPPWVRDFTLQQETKKVGRITTQIWEVVQHGDEWDKRWQWSMDYNYVTNVAIPTKYIFEVRDGFGQEDKKEELDYSFEGLQKSDITFKLEDYCSNL